MDELRGPKAEPEKHAQAVTDGLLAAFRKHDKDATATFEISDHPYYSGAKVVRIEASVLGVTHRLSLSVARERTSRFSRSYAEALRIESELFGHLRRVKQLKNGDFNYSRIAEGIASESLRRAQGHADDRVRAENAAAHQAIIDGINGLRTYTAHPSTSATHPIRIAFRFESNVTPAQAESVRRFLQEVAA